MSMEQRRLPASGGNSGIFAAIGRAVSSRRKKWSAFLGVYHRFAPLLQRHLGAMAFTLLAAIAYNLMRILAPWPLKLIIDNVVLDEALPWYLPSLLAPSEGDPFLLLYALTAAIVIIAFAQGWFYFRQRVQAARIGNAIVADLRLELYKHVHSLSFNFHDRRRTGDIIVRLTSDIRVLRKAFVALPMQVLEACLLVLGVSIVMLVMDWQLAVLALGLLPLIVWLARREQRPMKTAVRKQREKEGHLATLATEALGAIKVVQGFRRERTEVRRFSSANKGSQRSGVKVARIEARLKWTAELAIAVVTAIIVTLSTLRILSGSLQPGDLIVFVAYLRIYARPLQRVSRITERLARATASGERVLQILEMEPDIKDLPHAVDAPRLRGEILFDGVSFDYRSTAPVLSEVNLKIEPGQHVAIVGSTGAGKSSLVSLIPRFYEPTRGQVCIDGKDIRDYSLSSLRKQISMVFQEPMLFGTTIAENIAYGKSGASREDVGEAARLSGIARIIDRLPDGLDTVIGERGGTLSGGQRQCVAIARAMIRDAPIVIMDELTVGLDNKSAALVSKALKRLVEGRTAITITHKVTSAREADRIFVVDAGRIVESGSYDELLARGGLFSDLVQAQAGAES